MAGIGFVIGVFLGMLIGVGLMSLCTSSKMADKGIEYEK